MKLNTNLSTSIVAASFSALLFMSSCSQEDFQALQPENENLKSGASMKTGAATGSLFNTGNTGQVLAEYLKSTALPDGSQPGSGASYMPVGWSIDGSYGYGTSSTRALGGNRETPWAIGTLSSPVNGYSTFVTLKTNSTHNVTGIAISQLKNLKPGKKYELTYYVSANSALENGVPSLLSEKVICNIFTKASSNASQAIKVTNLSGTSEQWVKQSVVFTAEESTAKVNIISHHPSSGNVAGNAYVNVFVAPFAVVQVQ
ncbi:carbohydrate binding domain-containing protein [Dyadobacter flavalbus]|nr:carbohydrate binding domain-containing protein [Dyadobacter flavalbus]